MVANLIELRVVVVEPSVTQSRIIQKYLDYYGLCDVQRVGSGDEALFLMLADPPHLVVSSLYLPDMTGTDLVYRMRNTPALEHISFILISSETNPRYLDPIRQAGTIAILPKPFQPKQLQQALLTSVDIQNGSFLQIDSDAVDIEQVRVLLVDDSSTARAYIAHILGLVGIKQISQAKNGKDAIPYIEGEYFDLIITDYNMPEMDGRELIEFIRQQSGQASVPVLMISSEQDMSRLAAVEQAGVNAMCDKPLDPHNLRELITNLIHMSHD